MLGSFGRCRNRQVKLVFATRTRLRGTTVVNRREALRILGIAPNATDAEVRGAFRRKALEHHPDTAVRGSDDSAVRELIDAYHVLIDPESRIAPAVAGMRRSEPGSGSHRINVRYNPNTTSRTSTRTQRRCQQCMGTGVGIQVITCPDCRGASLLTTLDLGQARVLRCRSCRGQGRVRSLGRCRICEGAGIYRPPD
jgi:DnaJ-class molecular chaperone